MNRLLQKNIFFIWFLSLLLSSPLLANSVFFPASKAYPILVKFSKRLKTKSKQTKPSFIWAQLIGENNNQLEITDEQSEMLYEIGLKWDSKIPPIVNKRLPREGLSPTLNEMGVELAISTPFHEAFWDSIREGDIVLDIGCSFGLNTREALRRGAIVLASDIDPGHLAILLRKTDKKDLDRLSIHVGTFPSDLNLESNSIDTVVLGQLIHFLNPHQVEIGFRKAYEWLKPFGHLFLMSNTIYGVQFEHIRDELEASIERAKDAIYLEMYSDILNKNLVFPTYLPDLKLNTIDQGSPMLHPHDMEITVINLMRVGFACLDQKMFSTKIDRLTGKFMAHAIGNEKDLYFFLSVVKLPDLNKILSKLDSHKHY